MFAYVFPYLTKSEICGILEIGPRPCTEDVCIKGKGLFFYAVSEGRRRAPGQIKSPVAKREKTAYNGFTEVFDKCISFSN